MTNEVFKGSIRKEWVTRGPDPTVVVQWRIYSTLPNGEVQTAYYMELEEFQGIIRGTCHSPHEVTEVPDFIAKQLHDFLEDRWQVEQEFSQVCCTSMEEDGTCRDHLGMRFGRKVDTCEHGYVDGARCRGCNPDGIFESWDE